MSGRTKAHAVKGLEPQVQGRELRTIASSEFLRWLDVPDFVFTFFIRRSLWLG